MRQYFVKRITSFGYAMKGMRTLLRTQPHARVHLLATVCVTAAGLAFGISRHDWTALILAMGLVWMAEAFNTALEFLTDLVTTDYHPLAGKAKDVAAAAVLLAAIAAAVTGILVFGPYVWRLVVS